MIILRSFKVVYDKGNNPIMVQQKILNKFQNTHDFGFDIYERKNWLKWLREYRTENNKLLPRESQYGDPIVYEVFMRGKAKDTVARIGEQFNRMSMITLFPGYDQSKGFMDIENKLDIKKYGRI